MARFAVETRFTRFAVLTSPARLGSAAPLIVTTPVPPGGDIVIFVPPTICVTAPLPPPPPESELLFNKSVPALTIN